MTSLRDIAVAIREAEPHDEEQLREIAFVAKASWGYDLDRIARWGEALRLFGETAPPAEIYVAENDREPVAWKRLISHDGFCILQDLWVEPTSQRSGVGSTLFRLAGERAHALGAQWLEWEGPTAAAGTAPDRRTTSPRTTSEVGEARGYRSTC